MGRRLVEHAAALHGSLTLEVYEKNTGARGFYARMGFVEESRRVDEEYDEVMLRLTRPGSGGPRLRRRGGAAAASGSPGFVCMSRANTDRSCRVSGVAWRP
ncbi:hypothetical protein SBADM41S_10806 [Streptomyces badius]